MDGFGKFIDDCGNAFVGIFILSLGLRCFKAVYEYIYYKKHYISESPIWNILCRAFSYNIGSVVLSGTVVVTAIIRVGYNKRWHFYQPINFLPFMFILLLCRWVNLDHSIIDDAQFIRDSHGLDSGSSMAANFFHGYLKATLPAHTNNTGIRDRIDTYEQMHGVKFAINRLIIVVPSKLFIRSKFDSPYLEKAKPLDTVYLNRAGVHRPYKNDVYRFTKPINNNFYYMALEGATPVLTFYETLNFQLTSTKELKELQREIFLKFYKYLKKLVYTWPETEQEIELIFYEDYKPSGEKQDIGEMLFHHFESILLSKESLNTNETKIA